MRRWGGHMYRRYPALFFIWAVSLFILLMAFIARSFLLVFGGLIAFILLGTSVWAFDQKPSRSKALFLAFFFIISLFSVIGLILESLPESGDRFICVDSRAFRIGYASSGSLLSGSFSSRMGSAGFFIVDEGNFSRWQLGVSYDSYSQMSVRGNINFTVPYGDTWYAVIYDLYPASYPVVDFAIHIILPPILRTMFFVFVGTIAGLGLSGVFGIAISLAARPSETEAPETEPILEPISRPAFDEEAEFKEGELKKPTFLCPVCGHRNPADADFCIGCGRDLDVTDDVARY